LANHTSEKVKKKVIELLYTWTQSLPSEIKITEAYQMLKRQSIILEDPVCNNKSSTTPAPQRTKSIFDGDEEKSKVNEKFSIKSYKTFYFQDASTFIKKSKT
jgi:ADP-ribosylation factor-binding protein GGA